MQRFGYVDTPQGQLHYRRSVLAAESAAAGATPVVLLHWAPGSSVQYAAIVEAFGAVGIDAVAPDLPGFGMSLRREGHWSIGDFAANLLEGLAALGLRRATLVGGHLSALIALEMALRSPATFDLLALDGTPAWDAATRHSILDKAMPVEHVIREDGSHLVELWKHLLWEVHMWRPRVPWSPALGEFAMQLLEARMLAGFDMRPARALLEYDVFAALDAVRVPVLALSADDDPLRNCHDELLRRVPGARGHVFTGDHPIHEAARATEFVVPILAAREGQLEVSR
jgi:pimeloyl-ACP methyl ester carboxylesterase